MKSKKLTIGAVLFLLAGAGFITWESFFSYCARNPDDPACQVSSPSPTPSPTATPTPTPTAPPTSTPSPTPSPSPTPTPTPSPSVPPTGCDEASIPIANVYVNMKEYSKRTKADGTVIRTYDSTIKIHNPNYCATHGMADYGTDCPLAPEGDRCRNIRERYVLAPHVCPRLLWKSCLASCPGTFDVLVTVGGKDAMHYINAKAGCPWPTGNEVVEAFWAQPEGYGTFGACLWGNNPDGSPQGCGNTLSVNQ